MIGHQVQLLDRKEARHAKKPSTMRYCQEILVNSDLKYRATDVDVSECWNDIEDEKRGSCNVKYLSVITLTLPIDMSLFRTQRNCLKPCRKKSSKIKENKEEPSNSSSAMNHGYLSTPENYSDFMDNFECCSFSKLHKQKHNNEQMNILNTDTPPYCISPDDTDYLCLDLSSFNLSDFEQSESSPSQCLCPENRIRRASYDSATDHIIKVTVARNRSIDEISDSDEDSVIKCGPSHFNFENKLKDHTSKKKTKMERPSTRNNPSRSLENLTLQCKTLKLLPRQFEPCVKKTRSEINLATKKTHKRKQKDVVSC